jgi:hypothetical protein
MGSLLKDRPIYVEYESKYWFKYYGMDDTIADYRLAMQGLVILSILVLFLAGSIRI